MRDSINEHRKYYNSKGEEVPSVTTVLKILNNNLDGWANWMGLRGINSEDYANEAASRGTYIHSICEKYFTGLSYEFDPDNEYLNEYQYDIVINKLNIVTSVFSNQGYEFFACELPLSGEKFGGTIDVIFYNRDRDDYIVCDFKSSKRVYFKHVIQLAGYTALLREKLNYNIRAVGVILIGDVVKDDHFINLTLTNENEYNVQIFTYLLNIYYLMDNKQRRFFCGR